jgi:hypothetical protein
MTFGVFGCACFLAYLWATYIVPETANVSLEMIDEVFRSPASREDLVVKRQVRHFDFHNFTVSFLTVACQVERDLGLHELMHRFLEEDSET